MTNAELLAKIKAEIERRIRSIENCPFIEAEFGASEKRDGKLIAYKDLLSFLSTLESEKPVPAETSGDLEKQCQMMADSLVQGLPIECAKAIPDIKERIVIAVRHGAFWHKRLMMEEAVEGEVKDFCFVREVNYSSAAIEFVRIPRLQEGDKVRVIIVKED